MSTESLKPAVIVTGASKGIGLAIVQILLEEFDASIVTVSRSSSKNLEGLQGKYQGRVKIVLGDVSDPSTSTKALQTCLSTFSHLTSVILNAGTLDPVSTFSSMPSPLTTWSEAFSVNVFSLVEMLKVCTEELRKSKGRVVVTSSGASTGKTGTWGCYNASKAAVNSIVRTYANEEKDIATFSIRPGVVETEMQMKVKATGGKDMAPEEWAYFKQKHEQNGLLKPEQPGYVMASLAVNGPMELSGQFISWDSEDLKEYRKP